MHSLAYLSSGEERRGTIVAFHGVTDSAASLVDIAEHYQKDWRVILADSLGHGLSPRFSEADLVDPFAAAVQAACEFVTKIAENSFGRSVVLLGHSMGGAIAAEIAVRHPELIRGLILEDPALLTAEQFASYRADAADLVSRQNQVSTNLSAEIAKLQKEYPHWSSQEVAGWAQAKAQSDQRFLACGVVGCVGRDSIYQIAVPTLLLTGDTQDVLWGESGLVEVNAIGNPLVQTKIIPAASHTVRRDAPGEFFAAVDTFIDGLMPIAPAWPSRVQLDPQIAAELSGIPAQTTWDLASMRIEGERLLAAPVAVPPGVNREVVYLNDVETRVFTGEEIVPPKRLLFAIHGGGYVAGKARYDDAHSIEMVQTYPGTILVTPEYQLAPEAPYPQPVEECIAAFLGALAKYPDLPVYLYGDSAGAGLVNQMLQRAEVYQQERIEGAIALEPCISPRRDTLSYLTYSDGPVWTRKASTHAWQHYAGGVESQDICPVDLSVAAKYPRMLIFVNAADPLRDEGIRWALQLTDAGVHVDLHLLAGTYHGALVMPDTHIWSQLKSEIRNFFDLNRFASKK